MPKLTCQLALRLTETERQALEALRRATGESANALVVRLILEERLRLVQFGPEPPAAKVE